MNNIMKIAAVGASMATFAAGASPASAQGYPYGYGNNSGGGIVGAIINSVTGGGYGQYPQGNYGYAQVSSRTAVSQCAAAVEQGRNSYRQGYNQGYGYQGQGYQGQSYQGQGYANQAYGYGNQAYGNQNYASGLRVVGITNVERRGNGGLKVSGIVQSSTNGAYGQSGYEDRDRDGRPDNAYNNGYNNGYNQGYGNQAYGNGYSNQGHSRFSCKVDGRGTVTEIRLNQSMGYRRGY